MEFVISRAALVLSLEAARRIVERRSTLPILGHVKVTASTSPAALTLEATDLDLAVTAQVAPDGLTVAQPGETTVPAHLLNDILRKLPDKADVSFQLEPSGQRAVIRCGKSRFTINALPVTDFPNIAEGDGLEPIEIEAGTLHDLMAWPAFAITEDATRYYLTGVYLDMAPTAGGMKGVATDGHRMAIISAPAAAANGLPLTVRGVIVPEKTAAEIARIAGNVKDRSERIKVELSAKKIVLDHNGNRLVSKVIDGTYPDYDRVVPRDNQRIAMVDYDGLAKAVDRVAILASGEKGRAVKLSIGSDMIEVSAVSPDAGNALDSIDAELDGFDQLEAFAIGFNSKYLVDALGRFNGSTLRLAFDQPGTATVITNPTDPHRLVVLMPMRVSF